MLSDFDDGTATVRAQNYLKRVRELIENLQLLSDERLPASSAFELFTRNLCHLPPPSEWRAYSKLCADGSPLELVETISQVPHRIAFNCDPGPYEPEPKKRAALGEQIALEAMNTLPACAAHVRELCTMFAARLGVNWRLWLGAEPGADAEAKYKVYWNFDRFARANPFTLAFQCLGIEVPAPTRELMQCLQEHGYPKMLGLSVSRDGSSSLKLYYRFQRLHTVILRRVAALAKLSPEPFVRYVRHLLRQQEDWRDSRAGMGITLSNGAPGGLALYHYPHGYFADDEDLRKRVLGAASDFKWDVSWYRMSSQLISAAQDTRLRSLLGFGVMPDGTTNLNLYARTGYLA